VCLRNIHCGISTTINLQLSDKWFFVPWVEIHLLYAFHNSLWWVSLNDVTCHTHYYAMNSISNNISWTKTWVEYEKTGSSSEISMHSSANWCTYLSWGVPLNGVLHAACVHVLLHMCQIYILYILSLRTGKVSHHIMIFQCSFKRSLQMTPSDSHVECSKLLKF